MSDAPKVPLSDWAAKRYSPAPSVWVLRQWVRKGEIVPAPELVGKRYYVEPHARRITAPSVSLVQRLQA
jgi:hypothetical protein